MKSKKMLIVMTAAILACSMFVACNATPTAAPSSSTVASTSTAVSTDPATLKGEVSLFAWLPDNPEIVENWKKNFTAKYPNIKLTTQMMTGQGLEENLQPRFASNNIPDVFSFELDAFSHAQVTGGKIADISDTKAWGDQVDAMKSSWTFNKVAYGISGGVCTTLMYYNMDLFTQAGITTMPTNWDEFLAVCEKLKAAKIAPLVWYGGFPNMLSNGPCSWGFANDVLSIDPKAIDTIATKKYDFSTNAGWLKMYEKSKSLETKGYLLDGFKSTDYQGGVDQFVAGKAAMIFAGTWQAAYLIDTGKFKTGLFLPPWNDKGKELVAVNASETGWSVGKNGNEKISKVLLDFMFYEDFNTYQNPRGCVTPFKTTTGNKLNEKLAAAMKTLNTYKSFTDLFGRNLPTSVATEGMNDMQSIYIDKTPAQVVTALTKVQNEYIATK